MIAIKRSESLRNQVYQALRKIILTGDLTSGDRIVETQLAKKLSVSRTPIREAIGQLHRDRLVVSHPNGGFKVNTLSIRDAIELYDCRIALEQLSVEKACQLIDFQQLKQLEELVLLSEQTAKSESRNDSAKLLNLDYQFHYLIAKSSANQWLLTLLEQVFDKMALLRIQTTKHNPQVLEIRLEHRQVYQAIADNNVELAQQMVKQHLTASKARVVRELKIINNAKSSVLK
jgi:DNA-binding GntR family transcriptional regulator